MSWEQLTSLADAYRRKEAERMLMHMVAAQGDSKSWDDLQKRLRRVIEGER
jgi:hypothetical protein